MGKIDYYIKKNVIDPKQTITLKTLVDCGLTKAKSTKFGIKILAKVLFIYNLGDVKNRLSIKFISNRCK